MVDIPEHLLQRSKERRKALGLPVPGEEGGEAEAPAAADAPAADAPAEAPGAEAARAGATWLLQAPAALPRRRPRSPHLPPPVPAVTRSGCSPWSSRGRSSRRAP